MSAAHQPEGFRGVEELHARNRRHIGAAGIDDIHIRIFGRDRVDAREAVFRMEGYCNTLGNIIRHLRRKPDPEVREFAVLKFFCASSCDSFF